MRLAVLASHEGTTLQAVINACADNIVPAEIGLVMSNNSKAGAIRRAADADIETLHISGKTHPGDDERDRAMLHALQQAEIDWVLLLGYMKKLGPETLSAFNGRILNTHPSLLPKFGGLGYFGRKVHEAVLDAGETESGATVHLVDTEYDTGPVLSQVKVPVRTRDTVEDLENRVKSAEQKLLVQTLIEIAAQRQVSNY